MLEQALAAKVPFRWVTGDEVYGRDPILRGWLAEQRLSYVLAIACKHRCGPRAQTPVPSRRSCRRMPGRSAPPVTVPTACANTPGPWSR
ncbi:transposase [Streptomyces sp. AC550_RSS872]|uniref:transposase n=1 Tax=Streptomyces sp. AC550_RSS872 TaxID=2823689 RepID=UPI001C26FD8C